MIGALAAAIFAAGGAKSRRKAQKLALAALGMIRGDARAVYERCTAIQAEIEHHDLVGALRREIEQG